LRFVAVPTAVIDAEPLDPAENVKLVVDPRVSVPWETLSVSERVPPAGLALTVIAPLPFGAKIAMPFSVKVADAGAVTVRSRRASSNSVRQ
jgi:hypothetical protein